MDVISRMLDDAGISQEDKALWMDSLVNVGEEFLKIIVDTFSGDRELLLKANENIKLKSAASAGKISYDTLVEQEAKMFQEAWEKDLEDTQGK